MITITNDLKNAGSRWAGIVIVAVMTLVLASTALVAKKKFHPFDIYDHDMHMGFFEAASVACETCHVTPESYGDRTQVNRLGCHTCHNSPNPPLPGTNECKVCHPAGVPKPQSHKGDWIGRHQSFAKQKPAECRQCHADAIFCMNCHARRDTIQQKVHRRNFRFFHSIEARANPRKCDSCHTVDFCQTCHAGRGTSLR